MFFQHRMVALIFRELNGMVHTGINLIANQQDNGQQHNPHHNSQHYSNRAVQFVVRTKLGDVKRENI